MGDHRRPAATIGRYQIFEELGRGGMGVVYRGFDPVIGRTVALKTILSESDNADVETFRQRLYREAAAAGALTHPNIVAVFDVVEVGPMTAVAMEFIDGETLADVIDRGPIPIATAIALLSQMCAGLDYAGSRGIVHRDIKPANILIGADGRLKIADFGIARLPASLLTQAGMVLGSPGYMSPEQIRGQTLDPRSDLFSVATVFYEMVVRQHPFAADDAIKTMQRILTDTPVPIHELDPRLHPGIDTVLRRGMAQSPGERYQTGAQFVAALIGVTGSGRVPAVATTPAGPAVPPPASIRTLPPLPSPSVTIDATTSARRALVGQRVGLVVGVVGLLLSASAALLLLRPQVFEPAPPTAAAEPAPLSRGPQERVQPDPGGVPPASADVPVSIDSGSNAAVASAGRTQPPALPAPGVDTPDPQAVTRPASVPAAVAPVPVSSEPVPPPQGPLWLDVQYAGPAFPVDVFDGDRLLGRLDETGAFQVDATVTSVRLVAEAVFFSYTVGLAKVRPADRLAVSIPGLGSAVIVVKNEVYAGVRLFLDDRPIAGPYPAQFQRLAAGPHVVRYAWGVGSFEGKELSQAFDVSAGGHLLIRAVPERDQVVVQRIR